MQAKRMGMIIGDFSRYMRHCTCGLRTYGHRYRKETDTDKSKMIATKAHTLETTLCRTLESHLVVQKDLNISEVDACRIRQPARLDDLAKFVHMLVVVPTRSNAIHRQPHEGT